jgi:hypothetical protein
MYMYKHKICEPHAPVIKARIYSNRRLQEASEPAAQGSKEVSDAPAAGAGSNQEMAGKKEDEDNGGSAWLEKVVDWSGPKVAAHIRLAEIAVLHEEQVIGCPSKAVCA